MRTVKFIPFFRPCIVTLITLCLFVLESTKAQALPTIQDQWQFFCLSQQPSDKNLSRAESKALASGNHLEVGLNSLNYACMLYAKEAIKHKRMHKRWQQRGAKGTAPKLNIQNAIETIKTANIRLTEAIKDKNDIDKALYHYGLGLALVKNDLAVNILDKVMTDHKGSKFLGHAYLTLGDFYLDKLQVANAQREYKQAIKHGNKLIKAYANYKLIWVDYATAISEKKIQEQRKQTNKLAGFAQEFASAKGKERHFFNIVAEDISDMLINNGIPKDALSILSRIKRQNMIPDVIQQMTQIQLDQGNLKLASQTIQLGLKNSKPSLKTLDQHILQIRIAAQLDNVNLLMGSMNRLVKIYGPNGEWQKKQKPKYKAISDRKIEDILFEFATILDQQGTQEKKKHYLAASEVLYKTYIENFPKSKKSYHIGFLRGQLLFQNGKHREAALQLKELINSNPKGKFTQEAANIMVTSAQETINKDSGSYQIPELGNVKRKITLPASKKLYLDCLDTYLKFIPKNENTISMHFAAGLVLYEFGHYIDAQKRYLKVITEAPTIEFSATAAYQLLLAFDNLKDTQRFVKTRNVIGKYANLKNHPEISPFFKIGNKPKENTPAEASSQDDKDNHEENYQEQQENSTE